MSNTNDNPMGFVYISESFTDSNVKNLSNYKNTDLFYVTFDANLQDFDVQNRNHRYYDASNVMGCINNSDKIQSLLRTGGWFGEFDHPTPEFDGQKLSPERIQNVPPDKRAFKIMNPRLHGNVLSATIQSAQGKTGEGFGKEVLAGWQPQFSLRAIATMTMRNGKPYVLVRKVITYDAPWYPSHAIAHQTSDAVVTTKSFTESVHDKLENVAEKVNDIMIPLKEILSDIGKTDINSQLIMESFDLTEENMIGFDDTRKHVIFKDEDNYIYTNINPKSAHMVNDFFNSFK